MEKKIEVIVKSSVNLRTEQIKIMKVYSNTMLKLGEK